MYIVEKKKKGVSIQCIIKIVSLLCIMVVLLSMYACMHVCMQICVYAGMFACIYDLHLHAPVPAAARLATASAGDGGSSDIGSIGGSPHVLKISTARRFVSYASTRMSSTAWSKSMHTLGTPLIFIG